VYDENSSQEIHLIKNKFYKIMSSCFEPYLRQYIDLQDKTLAGMFDGYKAKPIRDEEDVIIASSTDLFYYYRQTMGSFAQYSTKNAFADLSKLFSKWLKIYADFLNSKVPKENPKGASEDDIKVICMILNTADYCSITTNQLEEKMSECIDESLKSKISFTTESDGFLSISGSVLQALIKSVESQLEPFFTIMIRKPWGQIDSVGDQSEYVTNIAVTLSGTAQRIRKHLNSVKFYKTFCDKFAEYVFVSNR
jgi:hypothetical protein